MKKTNKIKILQVTITMFALIITGASNSHSKESDTRESTDSAGIIQRTITIKGTVDKPRTIFIIPRARLANRDKGSIEKYALEPLFPDSGIADTKK